MRSRFAILLVMFSLVLLLSNCKTDSLSPTATRLPNTPTETAPITTTSTLTGKEYLPTYQAKLTLQAAYTATSTITPIPITPTVTQTRVPMVPTEQVSAQLRFLWNENGGCTLPCWWGIVPGETSWTSVSAYFDSFANEISYNGAVKVEENRNEYSKTCYSIKVDKPYSNDEDSFSVCTRDNIVSSIRADGALTQNYYQLDQLLGLLGKPGRVGVQLDSPLRSDWQFVMRFFLYYPEKGVFAYYQYDAILQNNERVHGCIAQQTVEPTLVLWAQQFPRTHAELETEILGPMDYGALWDIPSIETLTDMNVDTFYESYLDPYTETCVNIDCWWCDDAEN
jgi:hypothetical protein